MAKKMKVTIFVEPGRIALDEKPIPEVGPLDALVRVTTTTICVTDVHIMKGEYPVAKGLTIGHEPVGVIEKIGSAVVGYTEGQRVIAGAITPSAWSNACLCGFGSQDGAGTKHGWKAIGGWKFGNTIDGCQAEYALVPDAMANLARTETARFPTRRLRSCTAACSISSTRTRAGISLRRRSRRSWAGVRAVKSPPTP